RPHFIQLDSSIRRQRPVRVMSHFPRMTLRIDEDRGIAAPERFAEGDQAHSLFHEAMMPRSTGPRPRTVTRFEPKGARSLAVHTTPARPCPDFSPCTPCPVTPAARRAHCALAWIAGSV